MQSKRRILSEIGSGEPLGVLLFKRNSRIGIEQKIGGEAGRLDEPGLGDTEISAPLRMIAANTGGNRKLSGGSHCVN